MSRTIDSTVDAALHGRTASLAQVTRDQRRVLIVALIIVVIAFWICVPLGSWQVAVFLAVGIAIALANHIASEYSLIKLVASGQQPSRNDMIRRALVRLAIVGGAAAAVAVLFWSTGIVTLIGLALFRSIVLMMTGLPLLKELKQQ